MNKRDLLNKKNVVLIYTGKKVVGGVETECISIRVGVAQKVPLAQLAKQDVVPKIVEGMATDVFQTEEIKALAVDRTSKVRPAPGGVSIGHPDITAGTLGMIVKKNGVSFILSNNHILANSNDAEVGDTTLQPGPYDGGQEKYICDKCHQPVSDIIGHLFAFIPITFLGNSGCLGIILKVISPIVKLFGVKPIAITNKVDCAISRPFSDEDISQEILELGIPTGFGEVKVGDKVKKCGRTTGLTEGDVIGTDGVTNVNYGGKVAVFEDQILTSAMSEGGDSGSAVLNEQNEAVGLLFAGSSSLTIINKIANVIDALGLDR